MISVIIPVYNGSDYLNRAITSCLAQDEVKEVIVINDGAIDNIDAIVTPLNDPRIRLLHHADRQNHGRSTSRNLGISLATQPWIAFCDADDYYHDHRFSHLGLIDSHPCDGYYDAIDTDYSTTEIKKKHGTAFGTSGLTGVTKDIPTSHLADYLISNREERISILGLVAKKSALIDIGLFDIHLATGEDTDLIWRLSLRHQLCNGNSDKPVASRWVDGTNTYLDEAAFVDGRYHFYKKWHSLQTSYQLSPRATQRINNSYRYYSVKHRYGFLPDWCLHLLRRLRFV